MHSARDALRGEMGDLAQGVITSLCAAEIHRAPFRYWTFSDALAPAALRAITSLPFAPPGGSRFDGRRETNNSSRIYFSPDIQRQFAVCGAVTRAFSDPRVISALTALSGAQLATGQLRIEYCQDVDGFWLEPHLDIPVKLITMLVYLSDDPRLADAGTDVYGADPGHRSAGRAPYAANRGLIFVPGQDTWHGFTPRPIMGVRKSLIINWVSDAWRATDELV